ncbi:MAG: hypothetical protein ACJ71D_09165 [Nitrososphaera sp.]
MQKSTLAYVLAALMLSTAVIYFVAAAQESSEAGEAQDSEQEAATASSSVADNDGGANSAASKEQDSKEGSEEEEGEGSGAAATQTEIAFFTIAGVAYVGVSAWIIKDKGKTNTPYMIAIGGSIAIIGLYVASRTIDLPIVGLQEDIGAIDILSKILQVAIIGLGAYMINTNRVVKPIPNR